MRKSQATCQKVVLFSRCSRLGTIFFVKMSNDKKEESITSEPSESSDQGDSMEEIEVIGYVAEPYEDEPLASDDGDSEDEEEADADGLTPAVLESRFKGQITVPEW